MLVRDLHCDVHFKMNLINARKLRVCSPLKWKYRGSYLIHSSVLRNLHWITLQLLLEPLQTLVTLKIVSRTSISLKFDLFFQNECKIKSKILHSIPDINEIMHKPRHYQKWFGQKTHQIEIKLCCSVQHGAESCSFILSPFNKKLLSNNSY